ncbi:molybdopterin-dependent oxidoreductase [Nocardioides sp. KIGAM211]|uniref:Molybdopterin-dependent oxidoreductase n=2 Tax=Nocardioides luti TaxID=2761101 RepID=A0A7X0VBN1_9ACTN|nr:molybdopterin-dependent oxidoreductase [Nocardioides luti]
MAMTIRESPVVAVAELVIRLTPGAVAEKVISVLGTNDKPFLVLMVLLLTGLVFAWAGRLAQRSVWASAIVFAALGILGAVAVALQRGTGVVDQLPILVGFVTWLVALSLLTAPLQRAEQALASPSSTAGTPARPAAHHRRSFLIGAGAMGAVALAVWFVGDIVGRGRRHVEETRRLLRLNGVSEPAVPASTRVGVDGVSPWMTPTSDFYRIHTAIVVPTIEPSDWQLRIHGMVDKEIVLSYQDLVAREFTEGWITLNCVSNTVGGNLVGNAWWSGVRLADILAEAGVQDGADAVLQTSDDGWTCGTPVAALTDDRNAMLAIAMNGKPLPIDHGFPVRTIVPGLYGYVSATKWVVDMEVTQFSKIAAYWTEKGWGEKGPVKMASRIDVPRAGDEVPAGSVAIGGVAWSQHTGISAVEIAYDGGDWQPAELAGAPTDDAWVQWKAVVDLEKGDHVVRVRATDKDGLVQTGVERDVLPDGATGWHTVGFTVNA